MSYSETKTKQSITRTIENEEEQIEEYEMTWDDVPVEPTYGLY